MHPDISRAAFLRHWQNLPGVLDAGQCDPFVHDQRLALYKTLMAQTAREEITGPGLERHIFWGHGFQLFWQGRSGRLGQDPARIDPGQWWGMMNFSLSVIPYLGAVQAGQAQRLAFAPPPGGEGGLFDLRNGPAEPWQAMIGAWADWFAYLASGARPDDLDALRLRAWHAHLVCIEQASALFADAFAALPAPERDFALGWTRMVDFLGAAARPTDLAALEGIDERPLAPCLLSDTATVEALPENAAVTTRAIMALGQIPQAAFEKQNRFWRRAMRRRAMRERSSAIIAAMFAPPLPLSMRLHLLAAAWRP